MGLNWNMGADVGDGSLNSRSLNKRLGEVVPHSGSQQHLTGAAGDTVVSSQLDDNVLYIVISPSAMNFVTTGSEQGVVSASLGDLDPYWPADLPKYHLSRSGSSDYIAARGKGSSADVYIYVVENREGNG